MFLGKCPCNPDNVDSFKSGSVSNHLPQMRMIGSLKLIFDENDCVGKNIPANDICPEWTNVTLRLNDLEFESEDLTQILNI